MPDAMVEVIPPAAAASEGVDGLAALEAGRRLLRWLTAGYALAVVLLAILLATASGHWGMPAGRFAWLAWLAEARRSGVLAEPLAALLIALAGLSGALVMANARWRAALPPAQPRRAPRWRRWLQPGPSGDPALVGRAARWPQVLLVAPLALGAVAVAWLGQPMPSPALGTAAAGEILGGAVIVLAFFLLIAERIVAAQPDTRLPEATALRALLFLPMLVWPAAGLLQLGAGFSFTARLGAPLALVVAAVGVELAGRAAAVGFLPPPHADIARAPVESLIARRLARGARGGIVAPIREHLGLDFARSWALHYVRAALPPVAAFLALLAWGLTGVVLVPIDQRAVYQRFGAPVDVLHAGLHMILPWPFGTVRRVDDGAVHAIALVAAAAAVADRTGAEDPPPPSADRLWEQAHPAEVDFLIASEAAGRQSFQTVSADIRVLWRVGLDDASALRLAYRTAAPEALLRAATGRVMAAFFARHTLDNVLGENREAMAERLRTAVQADLDRFTPGIDVLAVVLEAVHPPAGAADAYHNVQAAEISATTRISAERGRAAAALAGSQQTANELIDGTQAAAAEATGAAAAEATRFAADRASAQAGGQAFLLDRYFTTLIAALGRTRLTILDNRLEAPNAPVLDLRPPGTASDTPVPAPE